MQLAAPLHRHLPHPPTPPLHNYRLTQAFLRRSVYVCVRVCVTLNNVCVRVWVLHLKLPACAMQVRRCVCVCVCVYVCVVVSSFSFISGPRGRQLRSTRSKAGTEVLTSGFENLWYCFKKSKRKKKKLKKKKKKKETTNWTCYTTLQVYFFHIVTLHSFVCICLF